MHNRPFSHVGYRQLRTSNNNSNSDTTLVPFILNKQHYKQRKETQIKNMIQTQKTGTNLAEGGTADSLFVFARWQHGTDGLAAIRPPNLPFPGGSGISI